MTVVIDTYRIECDEILTFSQNRTSKSWQFETRRFYSIRRKENSMHGVGIASAWPKGGWVWNRLSQNRSGRQPVKLLAPPPPARDRFRRLTPYAPFGIPPMGSVACGYRPVGTRQTGPFGELVDGERWKKRPVSARLVGAPPLAPS